MPGNKSSRATRTLAHRTLLVYNALVVFLLAGFMSVTQQKIITSMGARAFLENLPAVPLSPARGAGAAARGACLALGGRAPLSAGYAAARDALAVPRRRDCRVPRLHAFAEPRV
ncbi:MAG: hypothetical protein SOX39_06490 [Selenomonas sp.]|nr:hypothetical protein [Selenomonas sp.]